MIIYGRSDENCNAPPQSLEALFQAASPPSRVVWGKLRLRFSFWFSFLFLKVSISFWHYKGLFFGVDIIFDKNQSTALIIFIFILIIMLITCGSRTRRRRRLSAANGRCSFSPLLIIIFILMVILMIMVVILVIIRMVMMMIRKVDIMNRWRRWQSHLPELESTPWLLPLNSSENCQWIQIRGLRILKIWEVEY